MRIEHSTLLTWPPGEQSQIVVGAPAVDGPWTPVLKPMIYFNGHNRVTVLPNEQMQFFQTTAGLYFFDDFDGGMKPGWEEVYAAPAIMEPLTSMKVVEDALNIYFTPKEQTSGYDGYADLYRPDIVLTDFAISMDLIDWDHSLDFWFGFWLSPGLDFGHMLFSIAFHSPTFPGQSSVWIWKQGAGVLAREGFEIDQDMNYRLVLTHLGNKFHLQLLERDTLNKVQEVSQTIDNASFSFVGIYTEDSGDKEGIDVTVDNFLLVGKKPSNGQ